MNIEQSGSLSTQQVDLAHEPPFSLGPVLVEPPLRKFTVGSEERSVEPKVMQVLVALGREPGAVLSRDDLIESCWNGRIVGDASIARVMSLLRACLRELADGAVTIETLPRVGYRLLIEGETLPPQQVAKDAPAQLEEATTQIPKRNGKPLMLAVVMLALLVGGIGWWWASRPSTEPLTVVMLPLEVGDGVDPLYATGMEAEIRAQFGRNPGMEVRGSESAGQLVELGKSATEIGRALDADLIWQGEVSNSAEAVFLDAKLVEAEDGEAVWAENLRASPDAAQFLPLRAVRGMLEALGRPPSPEVDEANVSGDDFALYLTAMGLIKGRGVEQRLAATGLLEQVVERNPDFADGIAGLAKANYIYPTRDNNELAERRVTALEQAEHALKLNPQSVDALKVSAMLLVDDQQEALSRLRRATELDPGDAEAWFWYSSSQRHNMPFAGDLVETARRMVEVDPLWPGSWRASDLAIEMGRFDVARKIERDIITASATDQQRLLAEARLARIDGDLSEFVRIVRNVEPRLNEGERRWGYVSQMRYTRYLLGLPDAREPFNQRDHFMLALQSGQLPSRAEFVEAGFGAGGLFNDPQIASEAIPLFAVQKREDELIDQFEARFGTIAKFKEWADSTGQAVQIIPVLSTYMALNLRRLGREADARAHQRLAREYTGIWKEQNFVGLYSLLDELNMAALEGDTDAAIRTIQRLPDYGWPLQLSHISNGNAGLLYGSDPLFDTIRTSPQVKALLDPIRAKIARERAEVLAMGVE